MFVRIFFKQFFSRVGYSSPYTLTDAGTMVKKGQLGDSSLLK